MDSASVQCPWTLARPAPQILDAQREKMASTGTELVQQAINHELAESDEVVELAVRQYLP